MSVALDYPTRVAGIPHRKPLPSATTYTGHSVTGNDQQFTRQPAHSHTRTASSGLLPGTASASPYPTMSQTPAFHHPIPMPPQQQHPISPQIPTRRTLSNATSSTSSSTANLTRGPTNPSYASSIRRSTSSHSTAPTSYVALMRKQKATVWCDRAQHEDPRLLAQQRAAKMRATMEVVGGHTAIRTSTNTSGGGVRSKIRHHGAVKASAYTAANLSGAGVPMRLSASEVDEENSDEEKERHASLNSQYHQRNGSGRSSLGSAHRPTSYMPTSMSTSQSYSNLGPAGMISNASTPPSADSSPAAEALGPRRSSDPEETPMPDTYVSQGDYFEQTGGQGNSGGSGSSGEERAYGDVSNLPYRQGGHDFETTRKTSEELRRRGSVDDRTMTMSAGRLFVANPDLSD